MFCKSCGKELPDLASFCSGCGAILAQAAPPRKPQQTAVPIADLGQMVGKEVKARTRDAWQGIKLFACNPVGGLHASYEMFDSTRAFGVAIVFSVIYVALLLAGFLHGSSKVREFIPMGELIRIDLGFKETVQFVVATLIPVVTLAISSAISRKIFRGKGTFAGDLYTASASMLPLGVLVLSASYLGPANLEVVIALTVFAFAYILLMLYAGCSRIAGIPEAGAAPAVPLMLLLTAWLTKVVTVAIFI